MADSQWKTAIPTAARFICARYVSYFGGRTPMRMTAESTGFDCFARIDDDVSSECNGKHDYEPGKINLYYRGAGYKIPLGFALQEDEKLGQEAARLNLPPSWYTDENGNTFGWFPYPMWQFELRPRSGLAGKGYVLLANSPGTIDADFKGREVCALVYTRFRGSKCGMSDDGGYTIKDGDPICQAVWPNSTWRTDAGMQTIVLPGLRTLEHPRTGGYGSTGGMPS